MGKMAKKVNPLERFLISHLTPISQKSEKIGPWEPKGPSNTPKEWVIRSNNFLRRER